MIKEYMIGNHTLGLKLVLRNVTKNKKFLISRFIRGILYIAGFRIMIELKFRNSKEKK